MGFVKLEQKGRVGVLTIDRQEALNALNGQVMSDLAAMLDEVEASKDIDVVVLTGAGRSFVAGADIGEMKDMTAVEGKAWGDFGNATFMKVETMSKPVICAVNGFALGGGCELAMACDIRIATGRSRFGQPETGLSIIPGAGGTQRLPRLVGVGRAKELIYTGRIITAQEAKEIGLVNQVTGDSREALMEAARAMALQIMKKGPVAITMAKMAINVGMDTDMNTGLLFERIAQTVAFGTEDRREGTAAFLEKRAARFTGH